MSVINPAHGTRVRSPRARRRALMFSVAGTAAATLTIWAAAQSLTGMDVRLGSGATTHVGALTVLVASALAALAAGLTRRIADRYAAHPRRTWIRLAIGVLVLSLAGPLSAGTTTATKAALACLHLVAAAVLVPTLAGPPIPTPRPGPHPQS
jgi:uncharacterized protein DUF6069